MATIITVCAVPPVLYNLRYAAYTIPLLLLTLLLTLVTLRSAKCANIANRVPTGNEISQSHHDLCTKLSWLVALTILDVKYSWSLTNYSRRLLINLVFYSLFTSNRSTNENELPYGNNSTCLGDIQQLS